MAYFATSSWSGLLVKNTYVASQKFDDDVAQNREMLERGWVSDLTMDGRTITYSLVDATGRPVVADTVTASVYRPVGVLDDQSVTLTQSGEGVYSTALTVDSGQWIARITAQKDGTLVYREVHRLEVPMISGALPRVGRVALAYFCAPSGRVVTEMTVTRFSDNRFWLIGPAAGYWHDRDWLRQHLPADGSVVLEDITARNGTLVLAGPRSRDILAAIADEDVSNEAFPCC